MADRVSVTICIGGPLRRSLIAELATAIEHENAQIDWEGTAFSPADLVPGQRLSLVANEVAWGRFDEIEWFCRCHGLGYVRWSGGCAGSFGPERVVFRNDGEPREYAVTDDDEVMISLETVRKVGSIEAIEAHFEAAGWQPPPITIVDDWPTDTIGDRTHG